MEPFIVVSVVCTVFNHERYLRKTLESIVSQCTSFRYEVLVHDDASTDNSALIIHEYAERYPNLIVPFYQKDNQYSKGVKISDELLYPRCRGKYVAICEGDDYWCNSNKLQRQYETLETHPDIDLCSHGAEIIDANCEDHIGEICPRQEECIIPVEDVIAGGGGFFSTNSLFMRKEIVTEIPPFRERLPIDYSIQINGALRGGVYYLPEIMSVYRANVPGSWTSRTVYDKKKLAQLRQRTIDMLIALNEYTDKKYNSVIEKTIAENRFDYYCCLDQERKLLSSEYSARRKQLSFRYKPRFYFKAFFPKTTRLIKKIIGRS